MAMAPGAVSIVIAYLVTVSSTNLDQPLCFSLDSRLVIDYAGSSYAYASAEASPGVSES
jgi:hypothetical protein